MQTYLSNGYIEGYETVPINPDGFFINSKYDSGIISVGPTISNYTSTTLENIIHETVYVGTTFDDMIYGTMNNNKSLISGSTNKYDELYTKHLTLQKEYDLLQKDYLNLQDKYIELQNKMITELISGDINTLSVEI